MTTTVLQCYLLAIAICATSLDNLKNYWKLVQEKLKLVEDAMPKPYRVVAGNNGEVPRKRFSRFLGSTKSDSIRRLSVAYISRTHEQMNLTIPLQSLVFVLQSLMVDGGPKSLEEAVDYHNKNIGAAQVLQVDVKKALTRLHETSQGNRPDTNYGKKAAQSTRKRSKKTLPALSEVETETALENANISALQNAANLVSASTATSNAAASTAHNIAQSLMQSGELGTYPFGLMPLPGQSSSSSSVQSKTQIEEQLQQRLETLTKESQEMRQQKGKRKEGEADANPGLEQPQDQQQEQQPVEGKEGTAPVAMSHEGAV